jgi:hypothetical protein
MDGGNALCSLPVRQPAASPCSFIFCRQRLPSPQGNIGRQQQLLVAQVLLIVVVVVVVVGADVMVDVVVVVGVGGWC